MENKQEYESEFESQFGTPPATTAGDALLQVALAEEAETGAARKREIRRLAQRFVVFASRTSRWCKDAIAGRRALPALP
jgi:hypothetical protein